MYQSGWVPAEIGDGSYGPYNQTGLMVKNVAMSTITPNTMKKNPPALAANTGMIGTPTTLSLVLPGPANCVCLLITSSTRCTPSAATRIGGQQQDVQRVEPPDDGCARELAAEQQVRRPRSDYGDALDQAVDDAQAVTGEQVVGQRVPGEALRPAPG